MRRIRCIIQYDGSAYVGWQIQPNGVSVQAKLEQALIEITGTASTVYGSGRTDSGVHAYAQVAHFDTEARMSADKFAIALNMRLPRDIRVLYSEEAPDDFHARFSAKRKTYRYTVQLGEHALVATRNTALHVPAPLSLAPMQETAGAIVGTHDFRAFMCRDTHMENTVRTIYASAWEQRGCYCLYEVCGNGFLYNMVRIIVGTLLDVGRGILSPGAIQRALATASRSDAGATAPAHGLMLIRLKYPDFDTDDLI